VTARKRPAKAAPKAAVAAAGAADPLLANLQKIDHLVILMLENRSFDHMLGYLSLGGGRGDVNGLTGNEWNEYTSGNPPTTRRVPVHRLASTAMHFGQDPCHRGACVDQQLANGNQGFVQNYHDEHPLDRDPGLVMGYFDAAHLPVYDFLASEYAISDTWFSSVPGQTWPNRLYLTSGMAAGSRDNKLLLQYRNETWVRHLAACGVSWMGYGSGYGHCSIRFSDANYRSASNFEPFDGTYGFIRSAEQGTLPAVSLIDPGFFANDDHPPRDVSLGQKLVARTYNALAKSAAWPRTLLVVLYDEHGGFYDHVVPGPAEDDDPAFRRYGARVPAFFIGPHVPRGRCFHTTWDHASLVKTILLRFCERDGRIPHMGRRVAAAAHLGEVLSEAVPRAPVALPDPAVRAVLARRAQLALDEFDWSVRAATGDRGRTRPGADDPGARSRRGGPRRAPTGREGAASGALDPRREAAAPRVVRLQVGGVGIRQQLLDQRPRRLALAHVGVDHHVPRVEGAHRDEARRHHLGHRVDRVVRAVGDLAHVDRVARPVRRVRRLVRVVEEQQLLAGLGVRHAHPARHARIVGDDAHGAERGEGVVGEVEQRLERLGIEPEDAKGHDACSGVSRRHLRR
jgi:phospholipase C